MKNLKTIALFMAIIGVSIASAYYDQYGNWHEDIVTETLDVATGGRFSDEPEDREARKKAGWELEDKKKAAQRKYQDKQAKIQRKKEERRVKREEQRNR